MPSWKAIDCSSKVPHDARVGDVDEEGAAAAAVAGRREVERLGPGRRRLHRTRRLRQHLEPLRHGVPGALHGDLGGLDELVAGAEVQLGIGAHRLEDLLQVVGADHLGSEAAVLVGELLDLRETDVVDLLGRFVGRREVAQRRGVRLVTVRQPAQAALLVRARLRQHLVAQHVAVGRHAGAYVGLDHRAQPGLPAVDVDPGRRRRGRAAAGRRRSACDSSSSSWATVSRDRERSRQPPVRHALALALGELAVVATQAAELVDERLGHVGVGQREHPHQDRHRDLRRRRSGRPPSSASRGSSDVGPGRRVRDQHGAGDPLLVVQPGLVDRLGPLHEVAHAPRSRVLGLAGASSNRPAPR